MPTPQLDKTLSKEAEPSKILNMPKLYRSLMALRLEVDQSIVEHLSGVIGEALDEIEQSAIKTTIERVEGIIGADLPLYGFGNMQGRDPSDDAKAKNELRNEQRQALSTLKQELLESE